MWKEFGNSLSDELYIGAIKGAGKVSDIYEALMCSEKFQSTVASLLLFIGESQHDVLWEILENSIQDMSDCQITI